MRTLHRVRVKVCCIASPEEAALAVKLGADALGLVMAMPSGPGVISEQRATEIAARVPPGVARFLLTSETGAGEVAGQMRRVGADVVQLTDRMDAQDRTLLRQRLPGMRIVQVVHVTGVGSVDEARRASHGSDALLLDSGRPDALVRELGGTGRVHDWALSRAIVEAVDVPVYLAGGLFAGNVIEAIRTVRPFGVDLCSGVRTEGRLDGGKLSRFLAACREAL